MELELVVAGLDAVVVVEVAGLDAMVGTFGATDDVWASVREGIAPKAINGINRVVGLMVERIVLRQVATRQASRTDEPGRFYFFSRASRRRAGNVSAS
jgi:hypothetical protein